jgi:hypothetical protein
MKKTSYIRFLNFVQAIENIAIEDQLDRVEESLLNHVAIRQSQGQELLVNDLIFNSSFGSQATLHKRVKTMVLKGYIELNVDAQDGRKKRVLLTPKAHYYFERLSNLLDKAAKVS